MLPRAEAVSALAAEPFDVLVVGGGITGAGVALDAATRGYSVALVERGDYAIGTSSRSSKLVHGGLRYLQNFDLGLVREALLERQLNVALAPHLVRPLPLVVPAFDGARPDRLTGIGLNMYDVMSVDRISPLARRRARDDADWSPARHRMIGGDEVLELVPALASRSPSGGYLFYDCQTDDVRLVLTVLAEAARFGAVAANRLEAIELLQDGGRACGARVRDRESGDELEIRADNVVNATGVWADRLRPGRAARRGRGAGDPSEPRHAHHHAGGDAAARRRRDRPGRRRPDDLRAAVARPDPDRHHGQRLRGRPRARAAGRGGRHVPARRGERVLRDRARAGDIAGAYAGVRPLISTGDPRKSVDISRKAELYETSSGMVTITGGKLTTWRRMAKMTVDRIVEREGRDAPCQTHQVPLGMAVEPDDLPRVPGVPEDAYDQLAHRYGYAAHEVLRLAAERPELAAPIQAGMPDLLAEAVYAARREQALTRRRRAAAAHAARAHGGARRVRRGRRRAAAGRRRARRRARVGRRAERARGRRVPGRGGRRRAWSSGR